MLRVGYSTDHLHQIENFLQPFCLTARLYLARIFVRGRISKKSFEEIRSALNLVKDEVWKNGTPDRIGDPDDTAGNKGWVNVNGYVRAYHMLDMKLPKFLF
jgi:hypothetical protein